MFELIILGRIPYNKAICGKQLRSIGIPLMDKLCIRKQFHVENHTLRKGKMKIYNSFDTYFLLANLLGNWYWTDYKSFPKYEV